MKQLVRYKYLYLLGLPGILYFLVFRYSPMYGLLIAFQDYNPFLGITGSEWVGLAHFRELITDAEFYRLFRNSFVISFLVYIFIFPAPIILALMLNELRSQLYRRIVQTVIYLPHFISWVIIFSLTYLLLSSEQGLLNKVIANVGGERIAFLLESTYFYPIVVVQYMWKEVGWGTIIYLAAIAGVDPQLYESAKIDGAGKWKQIWHVTIPSITPTIIILFLLNLGNLLDVNFEQLWLLQNPLNNHLSEVFDTYVYKRGVQGAEFSYSTAVGMFKSLIGLVLILGANYAAKKRGHEGLF